MSTLYGSVFFDPVKLLNAKPVVDWYYYHNDPITFLVKILRFFNKQTWLEIKLIDGRDNLTLDNIQRIEVTNETARPVGFCWVTFLSNTN